MRCAPDDAIVLDSFAGSGTTAHATLSLNQEDGGERHFILVELGEYADSVTAERLKRVISGYTTDDSENSGTGGSFSFYELGEPLLEDGNLNLAVEVEKFREYIWFTETAEAYQSDAEQLHPDFLGRSASNTSYFFAFDVEAPTVLDLEYLASIPEECAAESYVIFADICLLSEQDLRTYNVTFKKIPRDITRL